VSETDVQFVSNEAGEPTALIVPIELWREIASERETAHLLSKAGYPPTQALRVIRIVRDIQRDPFSGLGKPER